MVEKFNIYRLESNSEIEWIYAEGDLLAVLKWYIEEFEWELADIDSITLLPRKEWKNKTTNIQDPDGGEDIVQTFEEYCMGMKYNEMIASSEWE